MQREDFMQMPRWQRQSVPAFLVLLALGLSAFSMAQETAPAKKQRWYTPTPYRISLMVLAASATTDYVSRYQLTTHSDWICGYNAQNPNEYAISTTDTSHVYTSQDILNTCVNTPAGVSHANYMYDARQNNVFLKHDTAATIGKGLARDIVEVSVASYLEKRKGKWPKRIAATLNLVNAAWHDDSAKKNFDYIGANSYIGGMSNQYFMYNLSSWPPPRWWGIH